MAKQVSSLTMTAAAICIAGSAATAGCARETKCSMLSSGTVQICITTNGERTVAACYKNAKWKCEYVEKTTETPSPEIEQALTEARAGGGKK